MALLNRVKEQRKTLEPTQQRIFHTVAQAVRVWPDMLHAAQERLHSQARF